MAEVTETKESPNARAEFFKRHKAALAQTLDAIPFTAKQRHDIDFYLARMEALFIKANTEELY